MGVNAPGTAKRTTFLLAHSVAYQLAGLHIRAEKFVEERD